MAHVLAEELELNVTVLQLRGCIVYVKFGFIFEYSWIGQLGGPLPLPQSLFFAHLIILSRPWQVQDRSSVVKEWVRGD
jgi:hypothetical protein